MLLPIDLTPANRPLLLPDETLLFVQNSVGLYEGKNKLPNQQNGFAYLTTHRACYVDNAEPRKYSVAIELKDVDRIEPWAGFLKSSPKIALYLHPHSTEISAPGTPAATASRSSTPLPRNASPSPALTTGVWICTICSMSNPIPSNYIPGYTSEAQIPPCLACGIAPEASLLETSIQQQQSKTTEATVTIDSGDDIPCPVCTFHNHKEMLNCEICGAGLKIAHSRGSPQSRESPHQPSSPNTGIGYGPGVGGFGVSGGAGGTMGASAGIPPASQDPVIIKFSFRSGGSTSFLTHLKSAIIQRKWLLSLAPPAPAPVAPVNKTVGIGRLEHRGARQAQTNSLVLGSAFEDLESLRAAAKEVIALAESFSRLTGHQDSGVVQALGLVSKEQFAGSGSKGEEGWIDELSRQIAEFLADDSRGILKKEGGVMGLVDLWAVYNRARGVDLVSPLDLDKATKRFEALKLPVRRRVFKSGLVVVQEAGRTQEGTVKKMLEIIGWDRGVNAQEMAERLGWSLGVATEELEMAEELGAVCREVGVEGTRFWRNRFLEEPPVGLGMLGVTGTGIAGLEKGMQAVRV